MATQTRTNIQSSNLQITSNVANIFPNGRGGLDLINPIDDENEEFDEALAGQEFYPLSSNYSHLNRRLNVKPQEGALCLFQPLGMCKVGLVINGFCSKHLEMMNIKFKKINSLICGKNNKLMQITKLYSVAMRPQNIAALTEKPIAGCIMPFLEDPEFDENKFSLLDTLGNSESIETIVSHLEYFKMFISRTTPPEDQIYKHRQLWLDYMSANYNPKQKVVYALATNGQLINVLNCSLVTQAILGLYTPQSNGILTAPASIFLTNGGIYLNFNSCLEGTNDVCTGSILYAPTLQQADYLIQQITLAITNKTSYNFAK